MLTKRTYFFLVLFTCVLGLSALLGLALLATDEVQARELSPSPHAGRVFINELCAKNTAFVNGNGWTPDIIELYNAGEGDVSLAGWYFALEDEWYHFSDVPLENGGFLAVFCDKRMERRTREWHVSETSMAFDIPAGGVRDGISLYDAEGFLVDAVVWPPLAENRSWARVEDGGDAWGESHMTMGESNQAPPAVYVAAPDISHDSGFYEEDFFLELSSAEGHGIYYTLDGNRPDSSSLLYESPIAVFPGEKELFVIRAVCVDGEGHYSDIETRTYVWGGV